MRRTDRGAIRTASSLVMRDVRAAMGLKPSGPTVAPAGPEKAADKAAEKVTK
jgi:hypothetical protein